MTTNDNEGSGGKPLYPYYTLSDSIKVGQAVKELAGAQGGVSKALLAQRLNAQENSPSFSQRLSAARSFGVITGSKEITLTPTGRRYFSSESEIDPDIAKIEFLGSPYVFRQIIQKYDGSELPKGPVLANVLENNKWVPKSWKERVAGIFQSTAESVGVIDPRGVLRVKATLDGLLGKASTGQTVIKTINLTPIEDRPKFHFKDENDQEMETHNGSNFLIRWPVELDRPTWIRMKRIVDAIEPPDPNAPKALPAAKKPAGE